MDLTAAMTRMQSLYAAAPQPLHVEALLFCARRQVSEPDPGTFRVHFGKDGDIDIATVEGGACDCDPLAATRQVCAHLMAVTLYELLREEPGRGLLDGPLLERHIERVVSGSLMMEAPYSVNLTVEDTDGYILQFTVRKQDSKEFFQAAIALRKWVKEQGFGPKQWKAPAQEVPRHEAGTHSPAQTPGGQRPLTFQAATLHRSELDTRILWAVKGPNMPRYNAKFGMRVWDEVLTAAGFDVPALTRMPSTDFPSLVGWVAEYVNKDGEDKPDKIIYLRKG